MRTDERGFALIELVASVAVLALAGAAAIGAFAALGRASENGATRAAALAAAENVLVRARAAVAYAPPSGPPAQSGGAAAGRAWALGPGTTTFVAGIPLAAPGACGGSGTRVLALPVTTSYDPAAETFSVTIAYPNDACGVGRDGTIAPSQKRTLVLSETLRPSALAPGASVRRDVATPARM